MGRPIVQIANCLTHVFMSDDVEASTFADGIGGSIELDPPIISHELLAKIDNGTEVNGLRTRQSTLLLQEEINRLGIAMLTEQRSSPPGFTTITNC